MLSDTEIRVEGYRAVANALGDVAAERFVALIQRESFDYTQWQQDLWPNVTVRDVSRAAMEQRRKSKDAPR